MRTSLSSAPKSKASGATLLVCLILLLIMTMLGVSVIDNSSLQSQMAKNSFFSRDLYQRTLSEIEAQRRKMGTDSDYLTGVVTSSTTLSTSDYKGLSQDAVGSTIADSGIVTRDDADNIEQEGAISYLDITYGVFAPEGFDIAQGGSESYGAMNFEVNIVSTVKDTGVISNQTQGLMYPTKFQ
jgi:hypothetical protein